jgi:hypothetical protein
MSQQYGPSSGGSYQYGNQPSPYMQQSSAGNPASSYGSQGGAQAGAWGQPAPQQSGYQYSVPTQTGAPQSQAKPPSSAPNNWSWPQSQPQQQPGGYQYQPQQNAPSPQYQPQQSPQPTSWQYPQAPQQQGGDPYAAWMGQIMQPYQNQQPPSQYQNGSPQSLIVSAYQRYLGRTPSAGEINDYLRSGSAQAAVANIARSTEAQQYSQQGPQQQGGYQPQQQQGNAPRPGTSYVPSPGVNTDGYPQPRLTQMPQANAMPGWDNTKWKDPNHQTPKYVVGRLLQDIPPRTENMAMAMQRIQAAYPGARQIGPGDVSIPGVGSVDILQSAGAGGKAWQWGGGDSASKFSGQSSAQLPYQTAQGGGMESLIAMLMGGQNPYQQTAQAAPQVDPKAAAAAAKAKADQALAEQRAATAAAEQKAAQGPGGAHPSFAYY